MTEFTNLGDLIRRDRDPDKLAIVDLGGGGPREFTYRRLDMLACGVARALLGRGLERGDRVTILSANRAEYLAAIFGIMRAGLVAVPVNFKFPRSTIHFIVKDSAADLVFCDPERRADCPHGVPAVSFGEEFETFIDAGPFEAVRPVTREPAMFLYTSGSTGVPKGVVLSHQSHLWVVKARLTQDISRHRFLVAAPLYHMNGLAVSYLVCAGHATLVLLPQFTAPAYIDAAERYRCTWLTAVPPMLAMMLRETERLARADLSSVEFVRMGSAPVSESLMGALKRLLPKAATTNAYGTTEGGPVVFGPHPLGLSQPELSVGYPHPEVQTRLIDGAPPRFDPGNADEGELEMKSPAIMNGYHNRPDIPSPITADGFYRTGDVFRRDADGFHFFIGRTDDMFVSGGENIYPSDVERMLERHPEIAQAAVVPIEDEIKGQKPVAFVVTKTGDALSEEAVKQYALKHAPAYQHPRFVWFVERLPLSSTNKLDRAALKLEAETRIGKPRKSF
jgi:acyl-CoA synthetase (AMP-forming)/AMP-acid ligase II